MQKIKKHRMPNRDIHRLYEDKLDKLVHDCLSQEPMPTETPDWKGMSAMLKQINSTKKINWFMVVPLALLLGGVFWVTSKLTTSKTNNTSITRQTPRDKNTLSSSEQNRTTEHGVNIPNNNFVKQNVPLTQNNSNAAFQQNAEIRDIEINIPLNTTKKISNNNTLANNQTDWNILPAITAEQIANSKHYTVSTVFIPNENEDNSVAVPKIVVDATAIKNNAATATTAIVQQDDNTNIALDAEVTNFKNSNTVDKSVTIQKKAKKDKSQLYVVFDRMDRSIDLEVCSGLSSSTKNQKSFAAFLAPAGYNTQRLKNESALRAMAAGIHIKFNRGALNFTTGLNYTQIGDVVHYDTVSGGTTAVLGANGKTQFTYLDVPMLVGYQTAYKRWTLNLQGGMSTGILTMLKGKYASIQNFATSTFDVNENKNQFRNMLFNLVISPQISYRLTNTTNIFVSPTYKRNLQPITIAGNELNQRYNILGLDVGCRLRLK
jgi:hypothetical protein